MHRYFRLITLFLAFTILAACRSNNGTPAPTVTVIADGSATVITLSGEVTVSDVLRRANITYGNLDRINPSLQSRVLDGMTITIVRVREELDTVTEEVPFSRQYVPNDSMPPGDEEVMQAGGNGIVEVTYRITYWDGVVVDRSQIGPSVEIVPPKNEIIMYGSQGDLPTVTVDGTLVFISGDNAWIMRQTSANKRPLTEDGGLDRLVFELSRDGRRLLFTRKTQQSDATTAPTATPAPDAPFNSLWVVMDTTDRDSEPVRLDLNNIVYADWVPGSERTIVYSTAEPRANGWQANNDLWTAQISANGAITRPQQLLESSSGGVYGFFGMSFTLAPDGVHLAWAQADAVGVLIPDYTPDDEEGESTAEPTETDEPTSEPTQPLGLPPSYDRITLASFPSANVYDFIWRPGITWSPDGQILITTIHGAPLGTEPDEESPVFDLTALSLDGALNVNLIPQVGMWSFAQFSPPTADFDEPLLAYLEAQNPLDSIVSRYRLVVMDRDGSNRRYVFPADDQPGVSAGDLDYKGFVWSPDGRQIALIYQDNLYLIDVVTGIPQQITQDGFAESPRWMP